MWAPIREVSKLGVKQRFREDFQINISKLKLERTSQPSITVQKIPGGGESHVSSSLMPNKSITVVS